MKFIDLFSGIGGFRKGMEENGHECVGHCEIDKYADASYRAMHKLKEDEWYANDITKVTDELIRDELGDGGIECICSGFPCQAFSIAGKRRGFEDTRGTLFFDVCRFAKILRPKYLFLENVRGLLSHDNGDTFETILSALADIGYDAEWEVLNTKRWLPQNRERVFIIGHLRGTSGRKIFPIGESNTVSNNESKPDKRQSQAEDYTTTLRASSAMKADNTFIQIVGNCSRTNHGQLNELQKRKVEVIAHRQVNCLNTKDENGRRFKEDGEPMFTLTSQDRHGVIVKEATKQGVIIDDAYANREPREYGEYSPTLRADRQGLKVNNGLRIRKLTPLECFRLQGFPDELFYKAQAVNTDSQLYKQAGNSVTVNVIKAIAERFEKGDLLQWN